MGNDAIIAWGDPDHWQGYRFETREPLGIGRHYWAIMHHLLIARDRFLGYVSPEEEEQSQVYIEDLKRIRNSRAVELTENSDVYESLAMWISELSRDWDVILGGGPVCAQATSSTDTLALPTWFYLISPRQQTFSIYRLPSYRERDAPNQLLPLLTWDLLYGLEPNWSGIQQLGVTSRGLVILA